MIRIALLFIVWSCAFTSADPVCIVGAGPAGLTIAGRLQAKGLETIIFEKNPEVGGKCQAFYDDK
jgi:phytoene dehydrogenase-like protein